MDLCWSFPKLTLPTHLQTPPYVPVWINTVVCKCAPESPTVIFHSLLAVRQAASSSGRMMVDDPYEDQMRVTADPSKTFVVGQ